MSDTKASKTFIHKIKGLLSRDADERTISDMVAWAIARGYNVNIRSVDVTPPKVEVQVSTGRFQLCICRSEIVEGDYEGAVKRALTEVVRRLSL